MLTVAHAIRCVVYVFVIATIVVVVNLVAAIISVDIAARIQAEGVKYFKKNINLYIFIYFLYTF